VQEPAHKRTLITGEGPVAAEGRMNVASAVCLEAVSKAYGAGSQARTALRNVTVRIAGGTFTAVMGPSGSGKTTLLQLAAGIEPADLGRCHARRGRAGAAERDTVDRVAPRARRLRLPDLQPGCRR
jgi:ABC-type Fe3+/spermidine/putrescine transport system ATPase subunit